MAFDFDFDKFKNSIDEDLFCDNLPNKAFTSAFSFVTNENFQESEFTRRKKSLRSKMYSGSYFAS